jgi:hypothetical protein
MVVHGGLQKRAIFLVCDSLKHGLECIKAMFVDLCLLMDD